MRGLPRGESLCEFAGTAVTRVITLAALWGEGDMAARAEPACVRMARVGWLVSLIALSVLLNYVDRGAIGVAAPLMKQELGLSATGFGIAVSAFFWVYAPTCLLMGWLCDRFCVYRMFAAGVAHLGAQHFPDRLCGRDHLADRAAAVPRAGAKSIAFPGSSKIFAAEVPATRRGMANASVGAALAFGPAVGTLLGGTILDLGGWRPIFWIFGATDACCGCCRGRASRGLFACAMPPSPPAPAVPLARLISHYLRCGSWGRRISCRTTGFISC